MRRLALALITITLLFGLMPTPAQALSYPGVIVASAPERYYRLDETSGTTAIDYLYGNNGSYSNVTLNQSGAIYDGNAAVEFSGATNNGSIQTQVFGVVNRSWAVENWFLVKSGAANGSLKYLCYLTAEALRLSVNYSSTSGYSLVFQHSPYSANIPISIAADTWHYAVIQRNFVSSRTEIYLDGVLLLQATDAAYVLGNSQVFFSNSSTSMGFKIDEIALYGRILSQGEINLHYIAGASAINTATPTITYTPSVTPTSTNTPTPTVTPTMTPGWDYQIALPSGRTAAVRMEATAGDISIIMLLVFAVAILLLTIYLRRRDSGSK